MARLPIRTPPASRSPRPWPQSTCEGARPTRILEDAPPPDDPARTRPPGRWERAQTDPRAAARLPRARVEPMRRNAPICPAGKWKSPSFDVVLRAMRNDLNKTEKVGIDTVAPRGLPKPPRAGRLRWRRSPHKERSRPRRTFRQSGERLARRPRVRARPRRGPRWSRPHRPGLRSRIRSRDASNTLDFAENEARSRF